MFANTPHCMRLGYHGGTDYRLRLGLPGHGAASPINHHHHHHATCAATTSFHSRRQEIYHRLLEISSSPSRIYRHDNHGQLGCRRQIISLRQPTVAAAASPRAVIIIVIISSDYRQGSPSLSSPVTAGFSRLPPRSSRYRSISFIIVIHNNRSSLFNTSAGCCHIHMHREPRIEPLVDIATIAG